MRMMIPPRIPDLWNAWGSEKIPASRRMARIFVMWRKLWEVNGVEERDGFGERWEENVELVAVLP
jgi:hypothetical protein